MEPIELFVETLSRCAGRNQQVTPETLLGDLPEKGITDLDFVIGLVTLQISGRLADAVPATLSGNGTLTVRELVERALALPKARDPLFVFRHLKLLEEAFEYWYGLERN